MVFISLSKHQKNAKLGLLKSYRNKINCKNSRKSRPIMKRLSMNRMNQANPFIPRKLMMMMLGVIELMKKRLSIMKNNKLSMNLKRSHRLLRMKNHKQSKNSQRTCRLELQSFRQRSSSIVSASIRINKHPKFLREGMELQEPRTQTPIVMAMVQMIQERGGKCQNCLASVKMNKHQQVPTVEDARVKVVPLRRTLRASRKARSQWPAFLKALREVMKVQSREVQQSQVDLMCCRQMQMRQVSNFKENWNFSLKTTMPKNRHLWSIIQEDLMIQINNMTPLTHNHGPMVMIKHRLTSSKMTMLEVTTQTSSKNTLTRKINLEFAIL